MNEQELTLRIAREVFNEPAHLINGSVQIHHEPFEWTTPQILNLNDPAVILRMIEWLESKHWRVSFHKDADRFVVRGYNELKHSEWEWVLSGKSRGEPLGQLCLRGLYS